MGIPSIWPSTDHVWQPTPSQMESRSLSSDTMKGPQLNDEDPDSSMEESKASENPDCDYSCPFRCRNPIRFNIHDHPQCALYAYRDIHRLKKHIREHHVSRTPWRCPRCFKHFGTSDDVGAHLAVPAERICELSLEPTVNPEDGLSSSALFSLRDRRAAVKIENWTQLYQMIFPQDDRVPSHHFRSPAEHTELQYFIRQHFPKFAGPELGIPETVLAGKLHSVWDKLFESFPLPSRQSEPTPQQPRVAHIGSAPIPRRVNEAVDGAGMGWDSYDQGSLS
jgi:hypothetical protein